VAGFHLFNLLEERGAGAVKCAVRANKLHAGAAKTPKFRRVRFGPDVNHRIAMETGEGVVLLDLVRAGNAGVTLWVSHSKK
jgi:hypothetical protein